MTTSTPDPNPYSLDFLMSLDPLNCEETDILTIIQYHRNIRARRATGERGKRHSTQAAPEGIAKFIASAKPTVSIKRRGF